MSEKIVVKIRVKVIPNAKTTRISGLLNCDILKIHVAEKPVAGKANEAVIGLLARTFGIGKRDVMIKTGMGSRTKTVFLYGINESTVMEIIRGLSNQEP